MLDKMMINTIKVFMAKNCLTREEFAKDAGINRRTLYRALAGQKIKYETKCKIIGAMIAELKQQDLNRVNEAFVRAEKTANDLFIGLILVFIGVVLAIYLKFFTN